MFFEEFLNPLSMIKKEKIDNPMIVVDGMATVTLLKSLAKRYNSGNMLQKYKLLDEVSMLKFTMSNDDVTTDNNLGETKGNFFSKYMIHIIVGIIVLVLVCILLYFYGGYVHYMLTWPYHLLCKMVGDTTVTSSMTTAIPHWLFPFIETTVPVETVIKAGPGEFVKLVGYLLSAVWTACLGALAYTGLTPNE
jgi:hypothetical protein